MSGSTVILRVTAWKYLCQHRFTPCTITRASPLSLQDIHFLTFWCSLTANFFFFGSDTPSYTQVHDIWSGSKNVVTLCLIIISTHPCYPRNFDWFSWKWSKKNLKKRFKMVVTKKLWFFLIANSQKYHAKISWIVPWVSSSNWCEEHWCGSTYEVGVMSNISSKVSKKCIFCVLGYLWSYIRQLHGHIGWTPVMRPFFQKNPALYNTLWPKDPFLPTLI